jgi:bifunctional non-homologous end joining protein LigD
VQVARWVRDVLDEVGLNGSLKTSGKRGLHLYVPLPARTSFADAQRAGKAIAARVAAAHPEEATIERAMKKRPKGSVYVDYVQNDTGKSVAAPFSVRPKEGATVSTPLAWDELSETLDPASFTIATVLEDLGERAKLWSAGLRARNSLGRLLGRGTSGSRKT